LDVVRATIAGKVASMKRKIIAGAVSALLLVITVLGWHHANATTVPVTTAPAAQVRYVASSVRLPFHRADCKWARKISPKNLEVFETRELALAAGHRPCKVCQP
jgi:hypothetical protein